MEESINIKLPKKLVERFSEHMDSINFSSIESYLVTTLRQVLFELENKKIRPQRVYSEEEEKKIKERLNNIRYID